MNYTFEKGTVEELMAEGRTDLDFAAALCIEIATLMRQVAVKYGKDRGSLEVAGAMVIAATALAANLTQARTADSEDSTPQSAMEVLLEHAPPFGPMGYSVLYGMNRGPKASEAYKNFKAQLAAEEFLEGVVP